MIIRLVEPSDQEQWRALRAALWPDCTPDRHASEMRDYATRGGRFATFVACLKGNELCGFLEASLREFAEGCDASPVGYVEGIYVRPDARMQGIGRALVEAAKNWARENGAEEMASDCYFENEESRDFHLRVGFAVAARTIHFRGL